MHRRSLAAAAALVLAAPAAAAAQAPRQVTYFFHCAGPAKVQNLASLSGGLSWNTTAPDKAFASQDAAGCGFGDLPSAVRAPTQNFYDAVFSGIHAAPIEKIRLTLYNLVSSQVRQGGTVTFNVQVAAGTGSPLAQSDFTVTPEVGNSGATEMMQVEFTGLSVPAGAADRRLTITVDTRAAHPQSWVFDATEVPAHVTFVEPLPPAGT